MAKPTEIRKPAPAQHRPSHNLADTDKSNARCRDKSCCWRGICPIHTGKHPRGFNAIESMMRHRHQGGDQ